MSPSSGEAFVIVGASLAGAKAAETLRADGFDGRVVLIGEEPVRPYERPPMSKSYLRGETGFDQAAVHEPGFYDEQGIELLTSTTVVSIDPAARQVSVASGEAVSYDRLLLATGAAPRRLEVPGATLDGVLYLRTCEDSDAVRRAVTASVPVVVIGAGWIGAEVAASARQLGADVAMVEMASVPLERVLGYEVGAIYRDLHLENGVRLHLGVGVDSIGGGHGVEEVRLTDGTVLAAGAVIVGVGVAPRTGLAEAAGLVLDNGVVTDEHLAASATGIYAAGDVANVLYPSYGSHIRLEHWSAALNQGPVAAKNMLGDATPYDKVPYFFSDQYDLGMEYRGWAPSFDQVVLRGDPSGREFIAFWLLDGRVGAAMNANVWDQGENLEALVRANQPVATDQLSDPDVDLAGLVAQPG
jgi:3-phenylpropionate/trans-cinnamate dioxygenase ferredoxin reductase component